MQMSTVTLNHFARHDGVVESIQSRISCVEGNLLTINYSATGDLARLTIPAQGASGRADRLWEHTCFEAFLRVDNDSSYYEFNFSPSGEWAAYWFRGYRDGGPFAGEGAASDIRVRRSAHCLELDAVVHLNRLPAMRLSALLRIGLSAVIEASDGTLSYWALKHTGAKPDFHHPDSFAIELSMPGRNEGKRIL